MKYTFVDTLLLAVATAFHSTNLGAWRKKMASSVQPYGGKCPRATWHLGRQPNELIASAAVFAKAAQWHQLRHAHSTILWPSPLTIASAHNPHPFKLVQRLREPFAIQVPYRTSNINPRDLGSILQVAKVTMPKEWISFTSSIKRASIWVCMFLKALKVAMSVACCSEQGTLHRPPPKLRDIQGLPWPKTFLLTVFDSDINDGSGSHEWWWMICLALDTIHREIHRDSLTRYLKPKRCFLFSLETAKPPSWRMQAILSSGDTNANVANAPDLE